MRHARILALSLLMIFSPIVLAKEGSASISSACATLEFMSKMLTLDTMLPVVSVMSGKMKSMADALTKLNQLACQLLIVTSYRRGNSYYANGSLISNDLCQQARYFPNRQLFVLEEGLDTTIYYPNERIMAHHWLHGDRTLFLPNGAVATNYFRTFDYTRASTAGISLPTKLRKQSGDGSIPFNVWMMKMVKSLCPVTGESKAKALRS